MGLIVSALLAFAVFLGSFHLFVALTHFSCAPANIVTALISPRVDFLLVLICLMVAWVLAYFQKDIFTLRFIGTRFYGREQTSQGYITTKWLTVMFPILPVRSYLVVRQVKEITLAELEYQRLILQPVEGYFHLTQMLRTALISYATILWCLGCVWLMLVSTCF
jgi:hypothetical protein